MEMFCCPEEATLGAGVCEDEAVGGIAAGAGEAKLDSRSSITELLDEEGRIGSLSPQVCPVVEPEGVGGNGCAIW